MSVRDSFISFVVAKYKQNKCEVSLSEICDATYNILPFGQFPYEIKFEKPTEEDLIAAMKS